VPKYTKTLDFFTQKNPKIFWRGRAPSTNLSPGGETTPPASAHPI